MRAAAYARVSLEEQAREGVSLAAQQERIAAYCAAQDWELVDVYVDAGYSGKDLRRPALRRALAEAGAHRFDVLLVWRLDRLSRRQRDVLHVVEDLLGANGVGLRSITESFDTTTPAGKAMLGMLSVFAQLERETIVEPTKMGKAKAAQEGRRLGPPPYGYRLEDGRLAVQEPQASFVRSVYRRYLDGWGIEKLAAWASDASAARTRRGGRWHYNHLRLILTNPTYAGLQPHRGSAYPAHHEALVAPEDWRAVQSELERRGTTHTARVRAADYLLSGLGARCGLCGAPIHGQRSPANWPRRPLRYNFYYVCSRRIPERRRRDEIANDVCALPYLRKDEVEAEVIGLLRRWSFAEDFLRRELGRADAAREARASERRRRQAQVRIELADVQRRLARWWEAFEEGALTSTDLAARTRELREQQDALEAVLAEPEPDPDAGGRPAAAEVRRDVGPAIDVMSRDELRELLRAVGDGIRLYPDRVEVGLPLA